MHPLFKNVLTVKSLSLLLLTIIIIIHISLLFKTFMVDSDGNMRAAAAGYGDIPFHMTQVSKFAFQKYIDFNEPIFDGERLRYAFFINVISGLILRISGNWTIAMQAPVIVFMTTAILLMFATYKHLLKSYLGAIVAVFLFLFGSGFGVNYLIKNEFIETSRPMSEFFSFLVSNNISTITKWDAVFPDQNIGWGSPLSLVLLHQRSFILGFFIFTLFLLLLRKWYRNSNNKLNTFLLGILVGISPLAHYHSFVVMLVVMGLVTFKIIWKKQTLLFSRLILLWIIILFFSLPQITYLIQGKNNLLVSSDSFIKFRIGWMSESTTGSVRYAPELGYIKGILLPHINFLWINFGIILPLFGLVSIFLLFSRELRNKYQHISYFALLGIILFLLVQFIRFQPWDYDDNKILVYFQFFAAPVLVAFFMWFVKKKKLVGYITFILFLFFSTYSGIVDQLPRLLVGQKELPIIFNDDSIAASEFIKNNIQEKENIITSSTHLNIVASLSGRPVIVGYPGWLWTRGIDYSVRENNLRQYYSKPSDYLNIANFYSAKYVLIDSAAIIDWDANVEDLSGVSTMVFDQGQYQLYRLY